MVKMLTSDGLHARVKLLALTHSLVEGDVQTLAAASHGYVGADISALCQEAAMCALRRHVAAQRPQQQMPEQLNPELAALSPKSTGHVPNGPEASASAADAARPALQVWD